MCFKQTCYRVIPENIKEKKTRNRYIKLCSVDRKKCRKDCLIPDKTCPFIKRVLKC